MAQILGTDRIEILKLAAEGASSEAIALGYDYSVHDIRHLLVYGRDPSFQSRKLDAALAAEIRQRDARGESRNTIAAALGVHRNTVWRVLTGQTWKT